MQAGVLLFAFLIVASFGGVLSPICEPTAIERVSDVEDVVILQQMALSLSRKSPFFQLHAIEYATGTVQSLVPFNVVARVVVAPSQLGCVFVTNLGAIFAIPDVSKATSSSLTSVSALEVAVPESVQFSGDSLFVGFLSVGDRRLFIGSAFGGLAPRQVTGASGVGWFAFASDSSFLVFQNAIGEVVRVDSSNVTTSLGQGSAAPGLLSSDARWLGLVRNNGDLVIVDAKRGGEFGKVRGLASPAVLGWMGSVLVFSNGQGRLFGLRLNATAEFALSRSPVQVGTDLVFSEDWCVFADAQRELWIADASGLQRKVGENVTQFVVGFSMVAFVSGPGGSLWRAPFRGGFSVRLAVGARGVVGVLEDGGVVFETISTLLVMVARDFGVLQVSAGAADRSWVQGVSVLYRDRDRGLWTACTTPSTFLNSTLTSAMVVQGHLFLGSGAVVPSNTTVRGTAVLGASIAQSRIESCSNGTVFLVVANMVVGSFAMLDSRACSGGCRKVSELSYNDTMAVSVLLTIPGVCDESSFSWVVFGVVVGCAAVATVATLIALYVWNRRARKRAEEKLENRKLKYRAIERL